MRSSENPEKSRKKTNPFNMKNLALMLLIVYSFINNSIAQINKNMAITDSIYLERGIAKSDSGKHEEAIKDFNKALEIAP